MRLVCAATGPLPAMVEDGRFDAALYHQLSGLTIRVPALADHAEDIPDIAATLLTQLVDANEVPLRTLTVGALNVMRNLDWPGNLPVLQNVVKTLALTALANDIAGDDVNRVAREFNLGPARAGDDRGRRLRSTCRCAMPGSSSRSSTSCTTSGARKATCRASPIASASSARTSTAS